jgi:hypothetical protein
MSSCNQKHLICNFPETKKWTLIKCRIDLIKNRTEQIPTVVTHSWFLSRNYASRRIISMPLHQI